MKMKKRLVLLLLIGLICSFAAAANEPELKIGNPVPQLELPGLEGEISSLQNLQNEKPVILVFFAGWSKTCQEELQDLQAIYSENEGNLEVIAVSFDKKNKDLKSFVAKNRPPFSILHDKKLSAIDTFQILIIPTTFCINREGVIEKIFVDYDGNVKKALEEWVAKNHPGEAKDG